MTVARVEGLAWRLPDTRVNTQRRGATRSYHSVAPLRHRAVHTKTGKEPIRLTDRTQHVRQQARVPTAPTWRSSIPAPQTTLCLSSHPVLLVKLTHRDQRVERKCTYTHHGEVRPRHQPRRTHRWRRRRTPRRCRVVEEGPRARAPHQPSDTTHVGWGGSGRGCLTLRFMCGQCVRECGKTTAI